MVGVVEDGIKWGRIQVQGEQRDFSFFNIKVKVKYQGCFEN